MTDLSSLHFLAGWIAFIRQNKGLDRRGKP